MNRFKRFAKAAALVLALTVAGAARASVTMIGSQAAFSAAGTITQNTNWDGYGPNFSALRRPVIRDFTFAGTLEVGGIERFGLARNLLLTDMDTRIQIAGVHDLFAFNLGNVFEDYPVMLDLTTNLGRYSFLPMVLKYADGGVLTFLGFQTSPGEYFTSVVYEGGGIPGSTDLQLGFSPALAPEPATWALVLGGLGLAGAQLRRHRRRVTSDSACRAACDSVDETGTQIAVSPSPSHSPPVQ